MRLQRDKGWGHVYGCGQHISGEEPHSLEEARFVLGIVVITVLHLTLVGSE